MAVDYASSSSVAGGTRTNTTYTAPTGITNGDLLQIWHFEFDGGGAPPTPTPPSGFAIAPGTWPMAVSANDKLWIWEKIASGESGNYTVSHASCYSRGIMARISGNDTSAVRIVSQNSGTDSTSTYTGLTTAVDNSLVIAYGSDYETTGANLVAPSGGSPTLTERVDILGEYMATGIKTTAGATGNYTQTNNSANAGENWYAVLVAVRPAAGGGTDATVTAVPMTATRVVPTTDLVLSVTINAVPIQGTKTMPVPTVSDGSITVRVMEGGFNRGASRELVVNTGSVVSMESGFARAANRDLVVATTGGVKYESGFLRDAQQRLVVALDAAIAFKSGGFPRASDGSLVVTQTGPFTMEGGFARDAAGRLGVVGLV